MNLHEKNLKKVIKEIEKHGVVLDIQILNNSIYICLPSTKENPKLAVIKEIDFNRAKDFIIKFKLGDVKEELE